MTICWIKPLEAKRFHALKWFTANKVCFLTLKQRRKPIIENISVKKRMFTFLGAKIWAPIPVYRYEKPSGYAIAIIDVLQGPKYSSSWYITQQIITYSKSTIKTLQKGVEYVQS